MTTTASTTATSPMTGFSHVQLLVSDVAASEQWYTNALGLERMAADLEKGYVALRHRVSGVVVVLSTRPDPTAAAPAGPLDHLAFAVPDGDALAAWAAHLAAAGIAHDGVVLELGKPSLQLRDPDGIAIELVAPAPRP
ncbi:MAG TPA: VOC family protein [Acidimicrobiia bacterium]|nr:VOC family protein [Acidimicrobiia bacterium]